MGKIKVKSYVRQAPMKVRVMGQVKKPVVLQSLQKRPFLDRLEGYFRIAMLALFASFTVWMFGSILSENLSIAMAHPAIVEVPYESKVVPPVLQRIAKCESGGKQEVKHKNPRDIGKYGINLDVWGKKAKELGYDIYTEAGNEAMAMWIYHQNGTPPWIYSAKCWNK